MNRFPNVLCSWPGENGVKQIQEVRDHLRARYEGIAATFEIETKGDWFDLVMVFPADGSHADEAMQRIIVSAAKCYCNGYWDGWVSK